MIQKIQRDIDAIRNEENITSFQADKRRKISPPRREIELEYNIQDIQRSEDDSVQSSFSASYDKDSEQEDVNALKSSSSDDNSVSFDSESACEKDSEQEDVIDLDSSSSDDNSVSSDSESACDKDSDQDDVIELESSSNSDDDSVSRGSESAFLPNHDSPKHDTPETEDKTDKVEDPMHEEVFSEDKIDEVEEDDDDDDETVVNEMQTYYAPKIKQSKLFMVAQRFKRIDKEGCDRNMVNRSLGREQASKNKIPFDPTSVQYHGRTFYKDKCYKVKEKDNIVGIKRFLSEESCLCILIAKFEDTLLGHESDKVNYKADFREGTYVQVFKCEEELKLETLGEQFQGLAEIPQLIYQPQTPGEWYTFGYFYDRTRMKQGARREELISLELFAGAGGSLQGLVHES